MPVDPRTPILVGVGQLSQRPEDPLDGAEPLDMMLQAARLAGEDAKCPALLERAEVVRVSRGRWRYLDPARSIAESLGATGAKSGLGVFGGNVVQTLVNTTAREIAAGDLDVALLAGAEHGYSQSRAKKAGVELKYREAPGTPDWTPGPEKPMVNQLEIARRILAPVLVYPIFEIALRHHLGESPDAHLRRVSELWASFARVAADNPHAWIRDAPSAEAIRTPSASNRMVGFPYPKLMNSNDKVDQAASLLLCSVEAARRHGVPEDRWVYLHAAADAEDASFVSERNDLFSSPAIRIAGRRTLELAGCEPGDLDHVDLYSCFPSAVQIAARDLGLSEDRPLTVTGGLTFGGGPLNNYVMHSIARMAEVLRADPGSRGLVSGNGGYLTKHSFGVYSTAPPDGPFAWTNPQDEVDALPRREAAEDYAGEVEVESYTVMHGPEGPELGTAACLLPDGRRTWGSTRDPDAMAAWMAEDACGTRASIDGEGALTLH